MSQNWHHPIGMFHDGLGWFWALHVPFVAVFLALLILIVAGLVVRKALHVEKPDVPKKPRLSVTRILGRPRSK